MSDEKIETPSFAKVLQDAIDGKLCDLHTSLPAEIVSYDPSTQLAKIKPLLKKKYLTDGLKSLPVIQNVPVIFPRTKDAIVHLPIAKGDKVLAVFIERSIDKWISQGGEVSPNDPRKHDLSDAVAIAGLFPQTENISIDEPTALTVKNKAMKAEFFDDGKIKIANDSEELITILFDLLEIMEIATTNTIFGPMRWNEHSLITQIKARIVTLKKG